MNGRQFARFALVFAARDLFRGPGRGGTWVVVACLGGSFAAIVALFGWVNGNHHSHRERELAHPLALCLVADRKFGVRVTPEQRAAVDRALAARPGAVVGVFPFEDQTLDCQLAPTAARPAGEAGTVAVAYRAVEPADPLPRSLRLRPTAGRLPDRWFASPGEPGVVVTADFLEHLEYPPGAPPTHVGLRSPVSGTIQTVPVLGVTDQPLPLAHKFVVSADYEWHLRTTDPDVKAMRVKTGPLPPEWATRPATAGVKRFCRDRGWNAPVNGWDASDRVVWEFHAGNADGLPVSHWRTELEKLRRVMTADGPDPGDEFTAPHATECGPPPPPPDRTGARYLAVYVSHPDALGPVRADLTACGLRVDDDLLEKLRALDGQTRFVRGTLRLSMGALVAVVLVAVSSLLKVRLAARTRELGLLKAMGVSGPGLLAVYAVEGVAVGVLGVSVGAAGGLLVGWLLPGSWVAGWCFGDPSAVDAFRPDAGESALWAGGLVLFTAASVLGWVIRPVRSPPLLTLSGDGG